MGKDIEVVLVEDVETLGRSGDLRRVRAGYARNFLFPKKLAVLITEGTRRLIEKKRAEAAVRLAKEKTDALALLAKLEALTLRHTVKANEEGRLFGSVSAADVLEKLAEAGYKIEKSAILLYEPIKVLGAHEVNIRLHPEVKGVLHVKVSAEKIAAAEDDDADKSAG